MTWRPGVTTIKLDDPRLLALAEFHPEASWKVGQILFFGTGPGPKEQAHVTAVNAESLTLDGAVDPTLPLYAVAEPNPV